MGERRFCYKCMEKFDLDQHICPHCGYDDNTLYDPMYIIPGTLLKNRYLVGVLISNNGEGALYVGHDISTDCKVLLREYMPVNFCTRVKNKATISVNYNNLAKYKAFMAEYTELNKSLARLRNNSNINPILDMFAENNTTYTVFEYIDGEKMLDYLKDNAGELSWEQVSKLFPPLFTTIGILHNAGIIHRAISPDTVYITNKGELKLSDFCVSAARTVDAGLEHELFKGYAAPEQYSANSSSRQGTWTDVYGVSALLYRALTGCMPIDSESRLKNDDLCEPAMLNSSIPKHVSQAIMDGMILSSSERIQTITELVTRLFEYPTPTKTVDVPLAEAPVQRAPEPEPPVQQVVQPVPHYENRGGYPQQPQQRYYDNRYAARNAANDDDEYDDYRYEKVSAVDRLKVPVIIGILFLAILLIIGVVLMRIISPYTPEESSGSSSMSQNVVSDEAETTGPIADTVVPRFIDKFYSLTEENYKEYFTFDVTFEFSDKEEDVILEQDIEEGELVPKGAVIKLVVSKGSEGATIPSFMGLTVAEYRTALKDAGVSNYVMVVSSSSWGYPNTITGLAIEGQTVNPGDYFSNKDGKKLTVYYIPEEAQIQPPEQQQPEPVEPTDPPDVPPEGGEQPPQQGGEQPPNGGEQPPQQGGDQPPNGGEQPPNGGDQNPEYGIWD